jgi:GNAT superfamily N-acetyltransferase
MPKYDIRALTPEDLPRMGLLMQSRDDPTGDGVYKRLKLLQWLAFENPFANGEPTYFIAEENGTIIAHLGRMPMEFMSRGRCCKGYFIHDLYVHPQYRKTGQGLFISKSLYQMAEDQSDSFCCLVWTSELNLALQRRRGYYETCSYRYYKFFNPYPKIQKLVSSKALARTASAILQVFLNMADAIVIRPLPGDLPVSKIRRFDSRFDELSFELSEKIGIYPNKTSRYLNWRFLDIPFSNMEVYAVEKNNRPLGYAVVSVTWRDGYAEGVLVDLMADPLDGRVTGSLLKAVVKYFKTQEVSTVRCCLSNKRFIRLIKGHLFIKDFLKQDPVMFANLEKCDDADYWREMHNWHLTCCASDELMLEPLDAVSL